METLGCNWIYMYIREYLKSQPFVKALGIDRFQTELTYLHTETFEYAIFRNVLS